VIAGLRRWHRASTAAIALALPLGLVWSIEGRAPLVHTDRDALPLTPLLSALDLAAPRVAGEHLGEPIGPLAVAPNESEFEVFVVAPPSSSASEVLLYASAEPPSLKSDLPSGARLLGPFLRDGAPTRHAIERDAEPWIAAYSLPLATVVARFDTRTARAAQVD